MAKGHKTGGRQKGTPNKLTSALKDAIIAAATNVGNPADGGKGGLQGYLEFIAKSDVKAMAGLLGKVLPMQLTGDDGGPLNITIAGDDANLL